MPENMPFLYEKRADKFGINLLFAAAKVSGGGKGGVTEFAFQSETNTLASAMTTTPTTNRKRVYDRAIRRMKSAGLWSKARWIQGIGNNRDAGLVNWKVPSEKAVEVGTAAFVANESWAGAAGANYINTGLNANVLQQNNLGLFCWNQTGHMAATASQTGSILGAIDVSGNGISLVPNNTAVINGRCASASTASLGASDGFGLTGFSRFNNSQFISFYNGVQRVTSATASAALPALPIALCALNNNGTVANGNVTPSAFWWFGEALTESEVRSLTAIIGEYLETIKYGDYYVEEPGIGTKEITAQCVAYGLTGQSVCFALQAARAGRTVAIIGGWRDRFSFGMSGGGLGFTDFNNASMLGGLPRWIITRMNTLQGTSDALGLDSFKFVPNKFNRVMREMLTAATNGGFTIPVYLSGGVSAVNKSGTVIQNFITADGRKVNASQFFDGSYEGDLMRVSGCSFNKGREAAGSGLEVNNGVEAIADTAQPTDGAAGTIAVDPWNTPGTPGSGLLPGVHLISSTFSPGLHNYPATGSADTKIPAYNFRLTFTNNSTLRVPLPTSAPLGFVAANYELLLRQIAAAALTTPLTIATLFKVDNLRSSNRHDLNNLGVFGTNLTGGTWDYPLAPYGTRETIWKNVWNNILGIWYVLQHHSDARINGSALRTEALTWGACNDHYYSPHENDDIFFMPQMYVRESVRMQSDVVMNANHMDQTDGASPTLGTETVSVASYDMDSHSIQRAAHETSAGVWTTRAEGGMLVASGGVNDASPLPLDIFVPKIAEVTNLSIAFGCSTTHVSYGTTRMEFTAMQTGQSMGQVASQAITEAVPVQSVNYGTVRTALLASAVFSGEVAPVLPQTT